MKKFYLFFLSIFSIFIFAQSPNIQFQKTLGGSNQEPLYSIVETLDGGYVAAGYSKSNISGDKTQNCSGFSDYWIIKCNATGTLLWQKTIGGEGGDLCTIIKQTQDGGFILGGTSDSPISGDKTQNSKGVGDYWIVKLNASGTIEWDKTIGGLGVDDLKCINITADGGYILAGISNSPISGDKTQNYRTDLSITNGNRNDCWIVKITSTGTVEWDKTIGGDQIDSCNYIEQTLDGGFIAGCSSSSSISYEKTENSRGGSDCWILKLNNIGDIVWQKTIGGMYNDGATKIAQTIDGGYVVGGISYSPISGEKNEGILSTSTLYPDIWIVKLNELGNIMWQNTIGGNVGDYFEDIKQTNDGGYIIGGYSDSNISFDKTENNKGIIDIWVVKLNSLGNVMWDKTIGGDSGDGCTSILQTIDNGFLIGGSSASSISGDKSEISRGLGDFWIVKLAPENLSVNQEISLTETLIYPNPTTSDVNIKFKQYQEKVTINIVNILGQNVFKKHFSQIDTINCEINGASGIYFLTIENQQNEKKTYKIIKN